MACLEKHSKKKKLFKAKKQVILLFSLVLVFTVGVGTALAVLVDGPKTITNTFIPSEVTCEVVETFENNIKSNVRIKNTGDTAAYIRAAVVVTWQDSSGNISSIAPVEGTDYTINFALGNGWITNDNFYYYQNVVDANAETSVLISKCQPLKTGSEGYTLHVEILAQAIQAEPKAAVEDAWNVTVAEDGTIQ